MVVTDSSINFLSTHEVNVVPVELLPHPNPEVDSLSIVKIWNYTVVVKTEEWKNRKTGIYIPPDSIAPDIPEFDFLGKNKHIKVRKFKGVYSQGLLMPTPEGCNLGDDVADLMGITHYDPDIKLKSSGVIIKSPKDYCPDYKIESWNRYGDLFHKGDLVVVSEKLHGSNARFTLDDGQMYCGSHHTWQEENKSSLWWVTLYNNTWIRKFCELYPQYVLYGEVFGHQNLKYGVDKNNLSFRAFDIWDKVNCEFVGWDFDPVRLIIDSMPYLVERDIWVPILYEGLYIEEDILKLAKGKTNILGAGHIREGIVISTFKEKGNDMLGRFKLKIVSDDYYENKWDKV